MHAHASIHSALKILMIGCVRTKRSPCKLSKTKVLASLSSACTCVMMQGWPLKPSKNLKDHSPQYCPLNRNPRNPKPLKPFNPMNPTNPINPINPINLIDPFNPKPKGAYLVMLSRELDSCKRRPAATPRRQPRPQTSSGSRV